MLYAKVVLGVPVEGPFDYIAPAPMAKKIKIGARVRVSFGARKMAGFVVGLSPTTKIKKLKTIVELIDELPILDKNLLKLTKELSSYYCCSWGEAIETTLPGPLRRGSKVVIKPKEEPSQNSLGSETFLLHDLAGNSRWETYLKYINEALSLNQGVIVLLPDINSCLAAKALISRTTGLEIIILLRNHPKETDEWAKIKNAEAKIVIGTRSAVFAPLGNLGLIIIDEEDNSVYKQEQSPHYHVRQAALMRTVIEKARLILGGASISLESFYLAKKNKLKYVALPRLKDYPEIKVVDLKFERRLTRDKNLIFSKALLDAIKLNLDSKGKTLLFLNRKGFATFASCNSCGAVLRCPRCNINLVFHFKENLLSCHYCNYKTEAPKICPVCNSGYVRFSGTGTEKVESEFSRLFPQARTRILEGRAKEDIDLADGDIFVATSAVIKQRDLNFELIGVLGVDNALNRIDLRSGEKAFALLSELVSSSDKKMIIQSSLPRNSVFKALLARDPISFYEEELKQRKQLSFPPVKHFGLVKLRSQVEEKAKKACNCFFERLNQASEGKAVKVISQGIGSPSKLRGKFYWQILLSAQDPKKLSAFLKMHLKDCPSSGIIVTVDIDPL